MKILHVATVVDQGQSYGGPISVSIAQLNALQERGHDVRLIAGWTGNGHPPDFYENVPATLVKTRRLVPSMRFSALFSIKCAAAIARHASEADIVHIHLARDLIPLTAASLCALLRKPYVVQTHGMVTPDRRLLAKLVDLLLTRRALRGAARVYSLTKVEDRQLRSVAICNPQRLRNAVALLGHPERHVRRDQPLDILFLARLHPRKRVRDFISAANLYQQDARLPSATFSIVGPDDGDLAIVHDAAKSHKNIRYEGHLDHQQALVRLRKADIYVLPSENEPFPMSLLEAIAAGTPSVCTTTCDIAGELEDGAAVQVAIPQHPESLFHAISMLAQDPDLRFQQAQAGQAAIRASFGTPALADRLEADYTQVTSVDNVTWVTNIAPNYRIALWRELSRYMKLTVITLDKEGPASWQRTTSDAPPIAYSLMPLALNAVWALGRSIHVPNMYLIKLAISRRSGHVIMDGWDSPVYLLLAATASRRSGLTASYYRGTSLTHRATFGPASWLRKWYFRRMNIVFVSGKASFETAISFGVPPEKIRLIGNAVDTTHFERARNLRSPLPSDPTRHTYLFVGQLIERKNVSSLLRGFAISRRSRDALLIVGDGSERPSLESLTRQLSLDDCVQFLGPLEGDDLLLAYAQADTLVLPSKEEVWGLVVNEALAAGLCVVVSDRCGVAFDLTNNSSTVICGIDLDSIASALTQARSRAPSSDNGWTDPLWTIEACALNIFAALRE